MSFNRATMIPCKDCCRPATYTFGSVNWLQDITGTSYLVNAWYGIYSNSLSISYSNVIFQVPVADACLTFCDSDPQTHTATGSAQVVSDPATPQRPTYSTSCQETDSCPEPPCDTGSDWGCDANGAGEYSVSCISYTDFNSCAGTPSPFHDDIASTTIGGTGHIQSNGGSQHGNKIIDTDWYASGVKITGTPETFVGYPLAVDGCHAYTKGLRKMWAKMGAGGSLTIRWFVAKEWEEGEQNKIYYDSVTRGTNQLKEFSEGIQLNVDVGVQAVGEGSTTLFTSIRLGNDEGDGSFIEGDGWYDITNKEVEFQYRKPSQYSLTHSIHPDYQGTSQDYCCSSFNCGCTAYWKMRSGYVQILTSTDVDDGDGNCIWDAGAGGANFGGTWEEDTTSGIICKAGAVLSVS